MGTEDKSMRPFLDPDSIVIHHSLTRDGATVSWGAIRKYHMDPAGPYNMQDIGYHAGVELIGDHYEILLGAMPNEEGAHCKDAGMNHKALGICVVGNFDVDQVPGRQLQTLVKLVKWIMQKWEIPVSRVYRHSDFAKKTCPGELFPWDEFKTAIGSDR
jgi:hypothetical protein